MTTANDIEQAYNEIESTYSGLFDSFNEMFSRDEATLSIQNRTLKTCVGEQTELQVDWELLFSSIRDMERRADGLVEQVYGIVFKKLTHNSHKSLNTTEARAYAQADDNYIRMKKLHNRTIRLKDDCESVLSTIRARQFALKDLTNAIIAGVENHII